MAQEEYAFVKSQLDGSVNSLRRNLYLSEYKKCFNCKSENWKENVKRLG